MYDICFLFLLFISLIYGYMIDRSELHYGCSFSEIRQVWMVLMLISNDFIVGVCGVCLSAEHPAGGGGDGFDSTYGYYIMDSSKKIETELFKNVYILLLDRDDRL